MECKYDRKMPSGHNSPRPHKAGKIFNDLFRLASFSNEKNIIKWFIYVTDEEMIKYFNNLSNKLYGFFNLTIGKILVINNSYIKNKSETFIKAINTNDIEEIKIKCILDNNLASEHRIKIFEVINV